MMRKALAVASGAVLLTGCQFGGLNSLNMPGTAGHGSGSYKVTWTTKGDKAEVLFKNGKNEVKATATLEEAKTAYPNTAIMRTNEGVVKQLWIGGKTTTLVFSEKEKLNTQGE